MNAADAMFFEAMARDKANPFLSDAVGAKRDLTRSPDQLIVKERPLRSSKRANPL